MTKFGNVRSLIALAVMMALCVMPALASTVVIPNSNTNVNGPSNNAFPFNQGNMRVQQVFAQDQFDGLTGAVTQLAFRIDESAGSPFHSQPIQTEIRLCHTTKAPQGLSANFADNYGTDVTLVYQGQLTLSSNGQGFDITIPLNPIFVYNGTENLLVEYKVFGPAQTTQFDSAGTGLGQGGTPWTSRLWALDPNATTGSTAGDDGYVTQFTLEAPTPVENSSWGAIKALYRN